MLLLDKALNKINMYRLAIYYLASLVLLGGLLSSIKILPYNSLHIILPAAYLVFSCWLFNRIFAEVVKTKANPESAFITALILALIVGPGGIIQNLWPLTFTAFAAMASKYVLVWRGRHIFNPAALAVVASALMLGEGASWWVGGAELAPLVIIGGIILGKKLMRESVILPFLLTFSVLMALTAGPGVIWQLLVYSPLLFFTFVMLPEPQTSPKRKNLRIVYGVIVAVVLVLFQRYLAVPYTLELALLTGNFLSFFAALGGNGTVRTNLILERHAESAKNIHSFWFRPERKFDFLPGQFLEWTAYHKRADSRGIRRYFTVASSPTEQEILLAAKIPASEQRSTFKKTLTGLKPGNKIIATGPEGEFVLPADPTTKLAFVAGGIGVTPFRSMVKYMLDKKLTRDTVLLYASHPEEFAFKDVFTEAEPLGIRTVYETGPVDESMIKSHIPDWQERLFYVSGPEPMVKAVEAILSRMGIAKSRVKRDYFPGYEEL